MTQEEIFAKNLELGFEFDRYLNDHPKFAEQIPFNALVVLLPRYDRKLSAYNRKIARQNREPKQPLVYVEIAGLKPQKSRLLQLSLKNGKRASAKNSKPSVV